MRILLWSLQIVVLTAGLHLFLRFVRTTRGNPLIRGFLLCYDGPDPFWGVDLFDDNKINGTPTIFYDCSGQLRRPLIASWWESRTL